MVLAGNGVVRAGAAPALREFCRATGISAAHTFMGKGVVDADDPHSLGTVGLHSRDYALAGFEDADVLVHAEPDGAAGEGEERSPTPRRRPCSGTARSRRP